MARLRIRLPVIDAEGDRIVGATVKFYQPGTASVSGVLTTGTPFAGNLYAAVSGGSPISTTQTTDANGEVIVYTDTKSRVDVGIEIGGSTPAARVASYEAFELDPADVTAGGIDSQMTFPTGTLAAPSLAWEDDLDTGFNVDSDGEPAVVKDGVGILEVSSTSTLVRSPDGTEAATLTDAGVFTAPGLLRMVGCVYAGDHGIVTDSTSANAAANSAALESLWATVAADSSIRRVLLPAGRIPLESATALDHATGVAAIGMWLEGAGAGTTLDLYGSAGPWLQIATGGASSALSRGGLRDLRIQHRDGPTSGATIRLGAVSNFTLENIYDTYNGDDEGSLICVDITGSVAQTNIWIKHCKFETRSDLATLVGAGLTPTTFRLTTSAAGGGGLFIYGTELSGCQERSNGLSFDQAGDWDTVEIVGGLIKDHAIGIRTTGAGDVVNFSLQAGTKIDSIENFSVLLQPATNCSLINWQINGAWMHSLGSNIWIDETQGGLASSFLIDACHLSDAVNEAVSVGAGIDRIFFRNNHVNAATASGYAVDIGGAAGALTNAMVVGNFIICDAGADGALRVSPNAVPQLVGANMLRVGDQSVSETLSNSNVQLDRAFLA